MTNTKNAAKKTTEAAKGYEGFSKEERAAMRAHAKELKAAATMADWEAEVLAKIAEMPEEDRVLAERVHEIVKTAAPELTPKTWYGMPAYTKDGKNVVYFRAADKFKGRYALLGFEDKANLDDGAMWPVAYALTGMSAEVEKRIAELVRQAAS